MALKYVSTNNAPEPVGPYSQAIEAGGLVFCSGQISIDPVTNQFVGGDIKSQTRRVLENLQAVLQASGSSLESVIKTTIFLKRMDDFASVNGVYGEFFSQHKPARSTVEVSQLPKGADVEIEAIGLSGNQRIV